LGKTKKGSKNKESSPKELLIDKFMFDKTVVVLPLPLSPPLHTCGEGFTLRGFTLKGTGGEVLKMPTPSSP